MDKQTFCLESPIESLSEEEFIPGYLKILIIGGDPVTTGIARIVLESLGHHVLERESSLETAADIVREQPDAVLVDVQMPFLFGDGLIGSVRELAALEGREGPAFFLYSGDPSSELLDLVKEAGADGAIHKMGYALDYMVNFAQLDRSSQRNPN